MRLFGREPAGQSSDLYLVVGLGNIGAQYAHTRHNIGFMVVDEVARRFGGHFRAGKFKGDDATVLIGGAKVLLLKPNTLMNLSGDAVSAAARFYKVPPERILIIADETYLPVGKLRLRPRGGAGGHNGLWHVFNRMGTENIPRLRVGIGEQPPQMDLVDYVLSRFLAAEIPVIQDAVDRAAGAVETWVKDGMEPAMNRWNASRPNI
jgi:PTH1 family peptidyl-tRNA hydrolase